MTFKRKIYDKLLQWKNNDKGKCAILIEGARRVGKSTICEEFGKREYKSYLVIDFAIASNEVKDLFENKLTDLNTFFMLLSAYSGISFYERDTLIIFDEVQRFPKARQAIKYLVKDGRYDYIETGSLISIKENIKDIVIPSEERKINMSPLDFEEFLWAKGEDKLLDYIKECFNDKKPLETILHNKAMLLFEEYMLVGGMPQSISAYLDGNYDFKQSDIAKRMILDLYKDDIAKSKTSLKEKITRLYDNIPGNLSKHEKRVKLNSLDTTIRGSYEDSIFWLDDSKIANICYKTSDPNSSLALTKDDSYIKCYNSDTGLLISQSFSEKDVISSNIYKDLLTGNVSINEGMFFENIIAQMLKANGYDLYYYSKYNENKHRNDIEIDFIITNGSNANLKIYPIEVKSGTRYTYNSLKKFIDIFKDRIGESYIIHPRNLCYKENIICIPPYMTMCL